MKGKLDILVAKSKPYYFVSYNSEDADRVSEACKLLQRLGMPLWCDNDVAYGKQWEAIIAEKIVESEAVVLFVTKGIFAKARSFVRDEFDVAETYRKRILVIMLDDIAPADIPYSFALWWSALRKLQNCVVSHFGDLEEAMATFAENLGYASSARKDDELQAHANAVKALEKGIRKNLRPKLIQYVHDTKKATEAMIVHLSLVASEAELYSYAHIRDGDVMTALEKKMPFDWFPPYSTYKDRPFYFEKKEDLAGLSKAEVLSYIYRRLFLGIYRNHGLVNAELDCDSPAIVNVRLVKYTLKRTPYTALSMIFTPFKNDDLVFCLAAEDGRSINFDLQSNGARFVLHPSSDFLVSGLCVLDYDAFNGKLPKITWNGRESHSLSEIQKDEKDLATLVPSLFNVLHYFLLKNGIPGDIASLFPHYPFKYE